MYGLFAEDAIQRYKLLPEEQNELYKRKFVSIEPEAIMETFKSAESSPQETRESLEGLAKSLFSNSLIKFDAIIGGGGYVIGPNAKYITVLVPSEIKIDLLEKKLYKSSDDKLAALIHAFTNKFV